MFQMNLEDHSDYVRLSQHLDQLDSQLGAAAQRLFYLSVPPQVSTPIVECLGDSGLAAHPGTKLLLEKPFGTDLESATDLSAHINKHFKPKQVYRIDHYLAKEMAQNLIVFREGNPLFRQTWNKDFIQQITVLASEQIGIENRAIFYEQTGALRDLIQSHLLQLAALVLMEVPHPSQPHYTVPGRRLAALKHLHVPEGQPVTQYAVRGQYQGYRDEVANPQSAVETFASLTLESSDPTWAGVPIVLVTGKSLAAKTTEIRITYKHDEAYESNQLILRLQPDEGFELELWTKAPGYHQAVQHQRLKFAYHDQPDRLPEAYEQVLLDAINSDHTLFTTSDEVLETWRIVSPVQKAWALSDADLIPYQPGATPESIRHT